MNLNCCFPTAIFSTIDERFAEEMLLVTNKFLNDSNYTKYLGYKTTFLNDNCGLEKLPEFEKFCGYICHLGSEFLSRQGYSISSKELIATVFANEMHFGESHWTHTHPNSILSGTFYLQTPIGSSPIGFCDPRPIRKFISLPLKDKTEFNQPDVFFDVKFGLLLMWESWLEHFVPPNANNSTGRISLVFNLGRR
jgi:uncharacterized protein (TIGR02466 family)